MIKSIQAAVNALDPQAAFALTRTMEQVHDQVLANDRFTLILFASFAVVGLLLATVGIYGVMAFSVAQRSREMALRMALGATRNRVLALVVKEGVALACAGLGFGLIGAYFVGRAMQSILFGVGASTSQPSARWDRCFFWRRCWRVTCRRSGPATVEIMQLLRSE